ncbi:MAG: hypothetical protein R3F37_03490 [Candidatus Competibacteraceae bacterium]
MKIESGSIHSNTAGNASGETKGGEIEITARNIMISGDSLSSSSGILSITSGKGKGGNITITGTNSIIMSDFGIISAESIAAPIGNPSDVGNSGNISISSPTLIINGDIYIGTPTRTDGKAGNIYIDVASLELKNGAVIDSGSGGLDLSGALVVGKGQAGVITITATDYSSYFWLISNRIC